jgi:ribosome biogenesis protein UTP30
MTVVDLIDGHVSAAQCTKAIDALLKHGQAHQEKLAEHELLPGSEPHVWLVLAVKRMQPEKKLKPFKMCVAYTIILECLLNGFTVHLPTHSSILEARVSA